VVSGAPFRAPNRLHRADGGAGPVQEARSDEATPVGPFGSPRPRQSKKGADELVSVPKREADGSLSKTPAKRQLLALHARHQRGSTWCPLQTEILGSPAGPLRESQARLRENPVEWRCSKG
jgi:hypothetical protein